MIEEVKASEVPIILFIDEAHTLIGAGGAAGTGDAANLLKPALARGELRTIAATTWAEYKKYFEKDAALTRRFQVVKVEEPDEAAAVQMLRGVAGDAREAPQGADPRRGDRGGGAAVAPLHPGAAAARQGGQPARHRLRPRRGVAARHAGRGRGPAPPPADARGRARHHRPRGGDRHRGRASAGRSSTPAWPRPAAALEAARGALGRGAGARRARSSSCAPGCAARACRSTRRPEAPAEPALAEAGPPARRGAAQPPAAEAPAAGREADLRELRGLMARARRRRRARSR